MSKTLVPERLDLPHLVSDLPGPRARAVIERDQRVLSPSYTRCYPLVVGTGEGAIDRRRGRQPFPRLQRRHRRRGHRPLPSAVVDAIQDQAARLIHMSGTDFYYENMVELAEKLAAIAPGRRARRVYFGNSGTEAMEAAIKLARYTTGRDKFIAFYGAFHGRTMGALSLTASKVVQRTVSVPCCPA